ncbi:MAG TPA: tripartite tricarboxylate transporter substrate binding protein [Burkholderiales bacterium]|nr:tripartite tricarboxylate transporter substrate binding protein [Burkholderiales bacterium]
MRSIIKTMLVFLFAAGSANVTGVAMAQGFPAKPVRIVVGFAPGGATDLLARILGQNLSDAWKQSVVVDNRGGAAGTIGAEAVAKAAADGYTLLVSPQSSLVIAPSIYSKLTYDPLRDFAPVIELGYSPLLLVAHPSVPGRTFKEFAQFARAQPKSMNFGSGGPGTVLHLTGELLNTALGVRMTHVPYKGENPALIDVMGGQVAFMFCNLPIGLPYSRAGKLRALAIATRSRSPLAPDIPTFIESGVADFEAAVWNGLYAPARTSREVVARINADVVKVLNTPDVKERIAAQGITVVGGTPEQLAALLKLELVKWTKVVKASGVTVE